MVWEEFREEIIATFSLAAGAALKTLVEKWKSRDLDDARVVQLATETHIELVQAMRESVAYQQLEIDKNAKRIRQLRSQVQLYESMLREAKIDYSERLAELLEQEEAV